MDLDEILTNDLYNRDKEDDRFPHIFPLRLGNEISALARAYMNRNDKAAELFGNIKPIEGYEDFLIHGQPDRVEHQTTNGQWIEYSAEEFADILKSDPDYHGHNIRLLSCKSGSLEDGFAQQLANALNVNVIAPTETLWIGETGELFVTNSRELADMFFDGEQVRQTGMWKAFTPQKEKK